MLADTLVIMLLLMNTDCYIRGDCMNQSFDGYLFSKEGIQVVPASCCILSLLLIVLGIVTYVFKALPHNIFLILTSSIILSLLVLSINHFRYKDYRAARYCITATDISLKYGDFTIRISATDEYYISILRLFRSSGKAYSYHPYIVLWKEGFPNEAVHPFNLLKRQYILLPYSERILGEVVLFLKMNEIPDYPQVLHHIGNSETYGIITL